MPPPTRKRKNCRVTPGATEFVKSNCPLASKLSEAISSHWLNAMAVLVAASKSNAPLAGPFVPRKIKPPEDNKTCVMRGAVLAGGGDDPSRQ